MAKIHTHYDNLKVARMAPQEVIRAAYKVLTQKYHPDKNPGDEKAARIMAIVNTAYGILSDPARRKEHDDWIAAEEMEIAWIESAHADAPGAWEPRTVEAAPPYRVMRDPRLWLALIACFGAGCAAGLLLVEQPKVLPVALASVLNGAAPLQPAADALAPKPQLAEAAALRPSGLKALAVTQLAVPAHAPDCDSELRAQVAPNGEPWPASSGYVDGYPVANPGEEMQVMVDNSANAAAVFVKLYDLDRRANVRHAYVLPHESLSIDKLAAGRYEVRYQDVLEAGAKTGCAEQLKQAAAAP
ncbi:J domain-containing protein [Massilia sp. R2A-15]|uniref:J domain-containing protein n=1 Tax=Massilia sp. R2A-15 TaxID=3064278 RepID=UPI002735106E|nr:J domain-containing protein [Massilia sp. R2A-15]WLI89318.1 J domain-containing protein [Massilia sp. R2A-15]